MLNLGLENEKKKNYPNMFLTLIFIFFDNNNKEKKSSLNKQDLRKGKM